MKRWRIIPRSISTRLAFAIIITIIGTTVAQHTVNANAVLNLGYATEQQVFWNVATSLAERLQRHALPTLDRDALRHELYDFHATNPNLGLYVLDHDGRILFQQTGEVQIPLSHVPQAPLEAALSYDTPSLPLYAPDPRSATGAEVTFSVARIELESGQGYVFVTLKGLTSRLLAQRGQFILTQLAIVSTFIVAGVASLLSLLLFYALTRRFREVVSILKEFAEGNFQRRVPTIEDNELNSIGVAINSLADSVVSATAALNERDEARRMLVANISHDLRSPVSAMQLHLDLVEENVEANIPLNVASDITPMQRSLALLQRLVADLFELTKLETRQQFVGTQIDIYNLLQTITQRFIPASAQQSVALELDADELQHLKFFGDASLIERLLCNLLENALRYSPQQSTVRIVGSANNSTLTLAVHDQGSGIAESVRQNLFERGSSEQKSPGAGLGLALCTLIASLHGGTLAYQFNASRGSVFTVVLPLPDSIR